VLTGYQKLVRYYPKEDYWSKLLAYSISGENSDLGVLYILRLMDEVGVLNRPEDYTEYARSAADKAFQGEAVKILQKGFDRKKFGEGGKDADQKRMLADSKRKADIDRAQLPEFEKEAQSSKAATGQLIGGLGLSYYSFDMYDKAIEPLKKGIEKGGLRNADDHVMILGISYLRSGQKEAARERFDSIGPKSPLARAAKLWSLRTYN
jgi:tetratricopeptide (TPR) repeat protein